LKKNFFEKKKSFYLGLLKYEDFCDKQSNNTTYLIHHTEPIFIII